MGNCVSFVIDFFHSSFHSSTFTDPQRQVDPVDSSTSTARQMELGDCSSSRAPQEHRDAERAFDGVAPQASSSSSTVMKKGPWDVFINHRGCDTKHTLASNIYHTLDLVGFRAFLDGKELGLGDSITEEIKEAMRTAGLHIAIFSKRYAESPWCLAELSFMLKTGTDILPVFYHVKPDDLRWAGKGKGLYAPAFTQHEKKGRYSSSMLEEWKSALHKVSYISGHILNNDNNDEGMLLKSIVNSVLRMIKKEPLEVAKHPVGMDEIVEDFERSCQEYIESEQQVQIVGIVGFGGSGKTTLATELYNRKRSSFIRSSFLHGVRDAASKNALHTKQKKLLEDIRIQTVSFDNVREGKRILENRLTSLRVLIVLDDVDHEDQLDNLLRPKESLGSGSLVIVTTREADVLTKWGITSIYKMQPLQHLHAKQLFCWHAFLRPTPQEDFENSVEDYLHVCNGLPLSLKVMGGQLYGKRSKDYWDYQLDKIRRILPEEILQRLNVSYDALDEDEQEIFLDIACFFIGERRSSAIAVWDGSGWSGLYGWETLQNKCLVEVDEEERIRMHDHLRDLGRQIAKPLSPSRFWLKRQTMHIQKGTPVRGIIAADCTADMKLVMSFFARIIARIHPEHRICKKYIEEMRISNLGVGLQLLAVDGNDFTQECGELLTGLLWLRLFDNKQICIPSWLSLENIRVLELISHSNLETLWEDVHPPLELRELLIEEALNLRSFPRSIGHLKNLKQLSLDCLLRNYSLDEEVEVEECNLKLSSLPEEVCGLHSLEHLALRGCGNLSCLPSRFGDLVKLRHVDLSWCYSLEVLPESFKQLINLEYLNLSDCAKLTLESNILENITSLKVFDVSGCRKLQALPHNITNQASLGKLDFRYTNSLRELPARIGELSKLKTLEIVASFLLTKLPTSLGNLSSLTSLSVVSCYKLESVPVEVGQLYNLQTLIIEKCPELYEIESLAGLASLNKLDVICCHKIKKIKGLEQLTSLKKLNLRADNISAFERCIQSIQIENWPWEMTICGRIFPRVQSILDSLTFPGLLDSFTFPGRAVVNSLEEDGSSSTCSEINLSDAAILCYRVCCVLDWTIGIGKSNCADCSKEREWIGISVLREDSPLIKDGERALQLSIDDFEPFSAYLTLREGRLLGGERGSVIEAFKQLFQTLCKATSMS